MLPYQLIEVHNFIPIIPITRKGPRAKLSFRPIFPAASIMLTYMPLRNGSGTLGKKPDTDGAPSDETLKSCHITEDVVKGTGEPVCEHAEPDSESA